jgi:hypothetical protein
MARRVRGHDTGRSPFTNTLEPTALSTFLENDVTASSPKMDNTSSRVAHLLHPAAGYHSLAEDDLGQVLDFATGLVSSNGLALQPTGLRRYVRLFRTRAVEAWGIAWASSTYLGLHDHGGSMAAYHVVAGTLLEASTSLLTKDPLVTRAIRPGTRRSLGPDHAHELWNPSPTPALSVHVYSPPLHSMSYYTDDASNYLKKFRTETEADWPNPERWTERAIG